MEDTTGKSQSVDSLLDRNVGYVVAVIGESKDGIDLFNLISQARTRHSKESPLALGEVQGAIEEAEKRGLIESKLAGEYFGNTRHGNHKLYCLKNS